MTEWRKIPPYIDEAHSQYMCVNTTDEVRPYSLNKYTTITFVVLVFPNTTSVMTDV
jgi:hypothetical protein